uniref:Uncharacterized protein n=1 Tax=Setaria viridis TaxID=4556 RepID=A0A4U6T1Y6_SETVI|nr:hypothetical protein SEVIR_9G370250v2 [Setaria viridis]
MPKGLWSSLLLSMNPQLITRLKVSLMKSCCGFLQVVLELS